jgi:hypothetical protein
MWCGSEALRPNLNRSTVGYGAPDLIHLMIRDGDAAVGPVHRQMALVEPSKAVWQAVEKHVSARGDLELSRVDLRPFVRIGDVNGAIEPALAVSAIEDIVPFRRLMIAFLSFGTDGISAEGDFVTLQHSLLAHQRQDSLALDDDYAIGSGPGRQRLLSGGVNHHSDSRNDADERAGSHNRIIAPEFGPGATLWL